MTIISSKYTIFIGVMVCAIFLFNEQLLSKEVHIDTLINKGAALENFNWPTSDNLDNVSFSAEIINKKNGVLVIVKVINSNEINVDIPEIPGEYVSLEITGPDGSVSIEPSVVQIPGTSPTIFNNFRSISPDTHTFEFEFIDSDTDVYNDPRIAQVIRHIFTQVGPYKLKLLIHYGTGYKWVSAEHIFQRQ
jgi:hypothetical protein